MATELGSAAPARPPGFDRRWLLRSATSLSANNVALLLLNVAQSVLLARLLGPAGKGIVFVALLTINLAAHLASVSLGSSLQYHMGRGAMTLAQAWTLAVGFVAVLTGVGAVAAAALSTHLIGVLGGANVPGHIALWLWPALLGQELLNEIAPGVMVAGNRVAWKNGAELGQRALVFTGTLVIAGLRGLDVQGALVAQAIGGGLVWMAVMFATFATCGVKAPASSHYRDILGFGLRQHAGSVTARALKRMDSYLLMGFMGPAAVGVYSVASAVAELLLLVPRAVYTAMISFVSSNHREEALRVSRELIRKASLTMLLALPAFGAAGIIAIPMFFGAKFAPAVWPFEILAVSSALLAVYTLASAYLVGVGRPQLLSKIMGASALLNLLLSVILIPTWGLVGNALATVAGSAVATYLALRHLRSRTVPVANALSTVVETS